MRRSTMTSCGRGEDQAVLTVGAGRIALSTDTFVVSPLFFPGGDIGSLALTAP